VLKYLGTTVTDQNYIHEEVKRRLNSRNACYHSVQNVLSSCFYLKIVKIKIYVAIILHIFLYECETWSLTLGEEHGLRESENRVLENNRRLQKLHNEELHKVLLG
jgi:hypothetical protein